MADSVSAAPLALADPELDALVRNERDRQAATLDLVASENYAYAAVREAQGSILTNKYADGYPGDRHYDGCEIVDQIEQLAIGRAKALFGAEHANVQPYSGSSANAAVLHAFCAPGDTVLGFDFTHGGHPSHYDAETFAGRYYRGVAYGVGRDRLIDPDEVARIAEAERPKVIFAGGSCYPRVIDLVPFRAIADHVGARLVCDMAHFSGLVAGGVYPSPVELADACTFTVHKTLGGARGGAILCRAEFAEAIDGAVFPGEQGAPLMHVIAGKAVTFHLAATEAFADRMARTVAGARTFAAAANAAAGETGCTVVTGGTDVHLVLLDTSRAADAGVILDRLHRVGMSANAMRIAYDPAPPGGRSGLRIGATSLATRGFDGAAFEEAASIFVEAIADADGARADTLASRVAELAAAFPPELGA